MRKKYNLIRYQSVNVTINFVLDKQLLNLFNIDFITS